MKKIYLVIAGAFLILLMITSMLLSLRKKSTITAQNDSPFPTSIPDQGRARQQNNTSPTNTVSQTTGGDQGLKDLDNLSNSSNESNQPNLSQISPIETEDFKLQYSPKLKKIVVETKTVDAEQKFAEWAANSSYPLLINNPNTVKFIRPGQDPEFDPLISFLNIFLNMGQDVQQSNNTPTGQPSSSTNTPRSQNNNLTPKPPTNSEQNQSKVYYAQCGDQGSLPLPDGCTMCSAGCGAASAAMIASSYLGKQYDLKNIVNLYNKNGYLLGCSGSRYTDAHELLKSLGLKTTDYIVFDLEKADTVVPQLRKYLNAGWTFFALASFCSGGCGHYFWITDIDSKGNIIAYDPAYGRYQIPYNENSRYPYPLYRLAFGVKK